MNKFTKATLSTVTGLALTAAATTANAAGMDPYVELALIDTCKSTLTNKPYKMRNTLREYNLKMKTVALKVMCNGKDIIAFAEHHGADRTAEKLQHSVGGVSITDVAKVEKVNVTFDI